MDGPTGTPCTREEPKKIEPNSKLTASSPYHTTGNLTPTYPGENLMLDMSESPMYEAGEPEKLQVLQTKWAKTRTTYYWNGNQFLEHLMWLSTPDSMYLRKLFR